MIIEGLGVRVRVVNGGRIQEGLQRQEAVLSCQNNENGLAMSRYPRQCKRNEINDHHDMMSCKQLIRLFMLLLSRNIFGNRPIMALHFGPLPCIQGPTGIEYVFRPMISRALIYYYNYYHL